MDSLNAKESLVGLTSAEVEKRKKQGLSNVQPQKLTRSISRILSDNILTLFNALNVGLALLIFFAGSYRNLLFFFTVIFNVAIGIFQEVRAKLTIEKISVISAPRVKVVRDGQICEIHMEDLVIDDLMILSAGNQICADSVIVDGAAEVNESLLTGESDAVYKKIDSKLMSGSYLISGQCYAKVEHVGAENYSSKLVQSATKQEKFNSMLMNELNKILRIVSFVIVPLGVLLYLSMTILGKVTANIAIVSTAGALIGMIPQGLILLTSIALSVGTIKLARMKVLVQELYGIETLARVDVLCLDKTGTITEGNLKVDKTIVVNDSPSCETAMTYFAKIIEDDNLSINAIREHLSEQLLNIDADKILCAKKSGAVKTLPFSSARKMSSISIAPDANLPICGNFVLGAPEVILSMVSANTTDSVEELCNKYSSEGSRVLLFAGSDWNNDANKNCKVMAIYVMSDCVRSSVAEVLNYFGKQDVSIYIFSGDNPATISKIAEQAGITSTNISEPNGVSSTHSTSSTSGNLTAVDAGTLNSLEDLRLALSKYKIFGRVSPEQKEQLVKLLKEEGHTVAMTGDGVNDVMALRAADCGIAMAGGAAASRSVANIVLLEDNIDGLPSVIAEGRRVINNICRSASLYLVKTIFSIFLASAFLLFGRAYPFQPIHLTLISSSAVGISTFFLSMEPNSERIGKHFLRKVIIKALPGSLTISINMLILTFIYNRLHLSPEEYSTLCVLLTGSVYFMILFVVCYPFNKWRAGVFATSLTIFITCFFFLKNIFDLTPLSVNILIPFAILLVFSLPVFFSLYKILSKYFLSSRESHLTTKKH